MEISKNYSVCFTGHRHILEKHIQILPVRLERTIINLIQLGYKSFIAGGAVGFDMIAAETVLLAQKYNPDIKLFLALPCRNQTARWKNPSDIERYNRLLTQANDIYYIQDTYTGTCMHKRNRWMVDHSAVCVAYLNNTARGGTVYTVNYANEQNLPVVNLANSNYLEAFGK